ncbi:MAG TPA: hypothetical protein VHA78_02695 [Candidatus Peribacteraceae bacterium]|nr:hypothetical protein [Candidatus Peribacteraceae bacterium]
MDRFEHTRRILAAILVVLISAGWIVPLGAALSLLQALLFTPHLSSVASYDLLFMAFRMGWLAFWWVSLAVVIWSVVAALKIAKHPIHAKTMPPMIAFQRTSPVKTSPAKSKAAAKKPTAKKKA